MAIRASGDSNPRKSSHPPEDTHEEAAYLKALAEKQLPVFVKLLDGEVVRGWIEYYDRRMIRVTREDAANLFIYKHDIAYIAEESPRRTPAEPRRKARPATGKPESSDQVDMAE